MTTGDIFLFNVASQNFTTVKGLSGFVPPAPNSNQDTKANDPTPSTEDKLKRLFGIQKGVPHEFSAKDQISIKLLDYHGSQHNGTVLLVKGSITVSKGFIFPNDYETPQGLCVAFVVRNLFTALSGLTRLQFCLFNFHRYW